MMNVKMLKDLVEIAILKGCDIENMWLEIIATCDELGIEIDLMDRVMISLAERMYRTAKGEVVCKAN